MGEDEVFSLLNQVKYLYLRNISEPEDNSLRLVVEEAIADHNQVGSMQDSSSLSAEIRKDAWPIRSTDKCRAFELKWSRYVAYLVTEEGVGSGASDEDEVYTGDVLRVYTKSHFLDHLSRDTAGHIGPILHYKLICQNHLIDVASYSPPEVRFFIAVSESNGTKVTPN